MQKIEQLSKSKLINIVNELYAKDDNKSLIDYYLIDTDDELVMLHQLGMSASEIAKIKGYTIQRVMYTLKKEGVYTPSKKGRKKKEKEVQ